jgi:hypothetical protein
MSTPREDRATQIRKVAAVGHPIGAADARWLLRQLDRQTEEILKMAKWLRVVARERAEPGVYQQKMIQAADHLTLSAKGEDPVFIGETICTLDVFPTPLEPWIETVRMRVAFTSKQVYEFMIEPADALQAGMKLLVAAQLADAGKRLARYRQQDAAENAPGDEL